jgi:phenylalanyl-tRNA synthetase alpha subunit
MSNDAGTAATTSESVSEAPENTPEKTPEFYESELKKAREEAAKYRTQKREAVEAAKAEAATEWQAKLDEQVSAFEALKSEAQKTTQELTKLRAVLPEDLRDQFTQLAARVKGDTPEEIEADAETVRALFGGAHPARVRAVDPSPAGKQPTALNDDDGLLAALKSALDITH